MDRGKTELSSKSVGAVPLVGASHGMDRGRLRISRRADR